MLKDYEAIVAKYQAIQDETSRKMKEQGLTTYPLPFTPAEIEEWQETAAMVKIGKINDFLKAGKEQEAADLIDLSDNVGKWRSANLLNFFYKNFTDEAILYRLIIDVYINDGYHFPKKVIMRAKQLARKIPESERFDSIADEQQYTVYRASNSPLEKVRNEISWTIDRDTAIWFAYRYAGEGVEPLKVYQGIIERSKIIAYTNGRNEFEVIQHGNVEQIQQIPIDKDEAEWIVESVNEDNQRHFRQMVKTHTN